MNCGLAHAAFSPIGFLISKTLRKIENTKMTIQILKSIHTQNFPQKKQLWHPCPGWQKQNHISEISEFEFHQVAWRQNKLTQWFATLEYAAELMLINAILFTKAHWLESLR